VEVVATLSQGRTAAAQCGLFTYKSVPVIFEPPCTTEGINKVVIRGLLVDVVNRRMVPIFTYYVHILPSITDFPSNSQKAFPLETV